MEDPTVGSSVGDPGSAPSTQPPFEHRGGSPTRLYRSRSDRILGGVCGGLGPYFDVDPVLIRLIFVVLALGGVGVLAYLILWIVTPARPSDVPESAFIRGLDAGPAKEILAWGLVALGLILLGSNLNLLPSIGRDWFWPLLLVIVGFTLLTRRRGPSV